MKKILPGDKNINRKTDQNIGQNRNTEEAIKSEYLCERVFPFDWH